MAVLFSLYQKRFFKKKKVLIRQGKLSRGHRFCLQKWRNIREVVRHCTPLLLVNVQYQYRTNNMVPSKPKKITANNGEKRTFIIFYEIVYDRILKDKTGTVVSSQCLCITGFRYFSIIIHTTSIMYMCLKIFNVLLVKIKQSSHLETYTHVHKYKQSYVNYSI